MNKLELVNALKQECSVSGTDLTAVTGLTGESARLVSWIDRAYQEIQNKYTDWLFLMSDSTFNTVSGTNIIPAPADLNVWDINNIYTTAGAEIEVVDYADFDKSTDLTTSGKPSLLVVKPDNTLLAWPEPDAIYGYRYDYFINPDVFADKDAVPIFPVQFHYVIVAQAMIYYANFESAAELKAQAAELYDPLFKALKSNQTPRNKQFYNRISPNQVQVVAR